jgi:hypothetical protein
MSLKSLELKLKNVFLKKPLCVKNGFFDLASARKVFVLVNCNENTQELENALKSFVKRVFRKNQSVKVLLTVQNQTLAGNFEAVSESHFNYLGSPKDKQFFDFTSENYDVLFFINTASPFALCKYILKKIQANYSVLIGRENAENFELSFLSEKAAPQTLFDAASLLENSLVGQSNKVKEKEREFEYAYSEAYAEEEAVFC